MIFIYAERSVWKFINDTEGVWIDSKFNKFIKGMRFEISDKLIDGSRPFTEKDKLEWL